MIDEQNHKVSYALNGAGQEYKDFSLNIEDYILAGNKHKNRSWVAIGFIKVICLCLKMKAHYG